MGHSKGKARNVRRFYKNLDKFKAELLHDDPKAVIIMGGDFNARVTQDAPHTRHPAVGPYSGSLTENKNGSLLKAFCHRNRMAIMDFFYQHPATRKNTWLSNTFRKAKAFWAEKGQCIDHFLVHYALKNAGLIMDVRVRANDLSLASDHRPQIMYLNPHRARPLARRLPRPPKAATRVVDVRRNLGSKGWLEEPGPDGQIPKEIYQAELAAALDALVSEENLAKADLTELAATIKTTITTCAQQHLCPKQRAPARNRAITAATLDEINKRNRLLHIARKEDKRELWNTTPRSQRPHHIHLAEQQELVARLVEADKVAATTREINGMNDARKAGTIREMWHELRRMEKRHNATIRRIVRLRGPDGQLIEGGPEAHAECMGKHFQAKFNRITNITTPMPDTPNEPLTDSLDPLPPMKPYYIEVQEKRAAKAVEELKRQEAAEGLAALQHGRPPQVPNNNMPKGKEPITSQEYKRALSKCKNNKSADKDGLSAELAKLGGEAMETVFIKMFNRALETGKLPRHFQIQQLIPLFKKDARDDCNNYRPIAITDFIYKLFSYIIYLRLLPQLEPFLLDEQRGFRPNRGTGDAIFTLIRLAEECRRKGEKVYVAFLDIKQAYDSVPPEIMLTILRQYYRVDAGLVDLISLIYTDCQGEVFFDGATSTRFPINIGVKQGCMLSPLLFSAFLDFVMRQSLPELRRWGVKWEYAREAIAPIMNSNNGNAAAYFSEHPHRNMDQLFRKIIVGLLYADDMALTSSSAIGLQHMVTALNGALKAWGLTLCPKKSRCMVFIGDGNHTPRLDIRVEGKKMAQVGEFCYLGTIISADGTCSATIDDRIRKAWFRLHQSHYIWRLRGLTRKARATFFRCIVLTTFFHGCERWTPSKADMTKLRMNHHNMLAKALNIPHWHRSRVPRAQLRHLMDDISDVDSHLEMRMLRIK